ncbi:transposable element Tcb2 transposase [Trichonephila clavipes]|nr:transposable element Tcb2 transposase [Trichonephila clavipes]
MATRVGPRPYSFVGPPCEGSENTQPRTVIGQIKKRTLTSHLVIHIRLFSRNHSQQISSNREEIYVTHQNIIGLHCSESYSLAVVILFITEQTTRKTTRREDRRIVRQELVDPTVTRSTIQRDVDVVIIPQTISRHIAEANLKSKCHFRVLPLTPEHRQLRLQWCQARSMWNVTDWQKVVFSDESRFVLGTDDNRVRLWRRPGGRYNSPTLFYVTLPAQLV